MAGRMTGSSPGRYPCGVLTCADLDHRAGGVMSEDGFGALLRARRSGAGLTQEELAERSGLSVRVIRDLERGRVARCCCLRSLMAAFRLMTSEYLSTPGPERSARRGPRHPARWRGGFGSPPARRPRAL
ncbi:helix-turn-helix domain-containing protein [Streptomyces puniciscabiei]